MKTMLSFEHGQLDLTPVVLQFDWVQITYYEIRDPEDNCVAYMNTN